MPVTIEEVAELAYQEVRDADALRDPLQAQGFPSWADLSGANTDHLISYTRSSLRRTWSPGRKATNSVDNVVFLTAVERFRKFVPADEINPPRATPAPVATVNDYKGLSLKEVLKRKRDEFAEQDEKNKHIIGEWLIAVAALFDQLEAWLKVADPEGRIKAERGTREVNEPGLGRYSIPDLNLRAFGIWIGAIPKAGVTIRTAKPMQPGADQRATGRVDITNGIRRYVLYRFPSGDNDEWFIHDIALDKGLQHLTAERFESVLLSYFR